MRIRLKCIFFDKCIKLLTWKKLLLYLLIFIEIFNYEFNNNDVEMEYIIPRTLKLRHGKMIRYKYYV